MPPRRGHDMSIPIQTETLVVADVNAAASEVVPDPNSHHVYRFFIRISAAANVQLQGSFDGTVWHDLLSAPRTASGIEELARPWRHLRVEWDNNTGNIDVELERLYSNAQHQAI